MEDYFDLQGGLDRLLDKESSHRANRRGNQQTSYGVTGGQSMQSRTEDNVTKYFGAAVPSIRNETQNGIKAMQGMTLLGKEVGFYATKEEWVAQDEDAMVQTEFLHNEIDRDVNIALVTEAFIPTLDGQVKRHKDDQNGRGRMAQVLTVSQILLETNGQQRQVKNPSVSYFPITSVTNFGSLECTEEHWWQTKRIVCQRLYKK